MINNSSHLLPVYLRFLAASIQRPVPVPYELVPKRVQGTQIHRHSIVLVMSLDDTDQPSALVWNRKMHALSKFRLNFFEFGSHLFRSGNWRIGYLPKFVGPF